MFYQHKTPECFSNTKYLNVLPTLRFLDNYFACRKLIPTLWLALEISGKAAMAAAEISDTEKAPKNF